jgi:hypothetical protein
MAKKPLPSPAELRQLLEYDPETGVLKWLRRPPEMFVTEAYCKSWNTKYAGKAAGTLDNSNGYMVFKINDRKVRAHRVVLALTTGVWPDVVDHLNGDRADNRLANLSSGSQSDNIKNSAKRSNNTTGITGVYWNTFIKKWGASIKANGVSIWLGRYDDFDCAVSARRDAEKTYGFSERHGK